MSAGGAINQSGAKGLMARLISCGAISEDKAIAAAAVLGNENIELSYEMCRNSHTLWCNCQCAITPWWCNAAPNNPS